MAMADTALPATTGSRGMRLVAWMTVGATFAYVIENYLMFWQGWPGALSLFSGEFSILAVVLLAIYGAFLAAPALFVMRADRALRDDADVLRRVANFIIRAAFWMVLLIGIADTVVSFLRVEEMLAGFVGTETANAWNFNANRAPAVHLPLAGVAILIAAVTRGIGFHWLALLVVLSELLIVLSRFIFSYEQAFMGDLVRFWYGALFLFASAYTLFDDGHVRVDVLYSGFRDTLKGKVNAIGAILMGIIFCWVVIVMGMSGKSSLINAPLLSLEVTQTGFGMFVKYLMAGFLGVFAVSMMVAFCSQLLEGTADWRGDPGSRLHDRDDELPGH
ncbi:MAG: TRAP transporter small permease subunit [Pseudomonadota bacterium]